MMNRRTALQSIGLGMGYTLSAGAFMSLVQSCQSGSTVDDVATWTPQFFKKEDTDMMTQLIDLILPKTDTPSASEAGVLEIMDQVIARLFKEEDKATFRDGLSSFKNKISTSGDMKESLLKILSSISEMPEEKLGEVMTLLNKEKSVVTPKELYDYNYYNFMSTLRQLAISSYFGSELIGEDHLAYEPVPGVYKGCINADENTKSWSLR